jgi:hypothetical protein
MNEFLNGKSMITPGVAGGLVLAISNTAFTQFGIPSKWSSLVLSFLLGTLVFVGTAGALWQKGILYLVNSAIIFSVAVGTNQVGAGLTGASKETTMELALHEPIWPLASPTQTPKPLASPGEIQYEYAEEMLPKPASAPTGAVKLRPAVKPPSRQWFHNWFD